jgi:hypothetical protein
VPANREALEMDPDWDTALTCPGLPASCGCLLRKPPLIGFEAMVVSRFSSDLVRVEPRKKEPDVRMVISQPWLLVADPAPYWGLNPIPGTAGASGNDSQCPARGTKFLTPSEGHTANAPTNGQFARPGEGDVTYKRVRPSFENLRRPVPFFPLRVYAMLSRCKFGLNRAGVEIREACEISGFTYRGSHAR